MPRNSPWYVAIDVLENDAPPYGTTLSDESGKGIYAAAGPELLPEVLAHEIAHAKTYLPRRKPRPASYEPTERDFKQYQLGEALALAYAYIKGWAGPRSIDEIKNYLEEAKGQRLLKEASRKLLQRKLISQTEYANFREELEGG